MLSPLTRALVSIGLGGSSPLLAPSAPTISASGGVSIGQALTIVDGGGGPTTSRVLYRDGVAGPTVTSGYLFVAADIGPSLTVKAVGPGGTSGASNAVQYVASGALWLKDTGISATAGNIDSWANSGTAGGSFTAAGAGRPTTGTQDSRTIAVFGGSPQKMGSTKLLSDIASATNYTVQGVVIISTLGPAATLNGYDEPALITDVGGGVFWPFISQSDGIRAGHFKAASQFAGAVVGVSLATAYIFETTYLNTGVNLGTITFRINGVTRTSVVATDMSSTLSNPLRIGANYDTTKYLQGSICELFVNPTTLSAGALADRRAYLAYRFPTAVAA